MAKVGKETSTSNKSLVITGTDTGERRQESQDVPIVSSLAKLGKRKNNCPYCNQMITNLSRHLVSQHPNEDDVRSYISLNNISPNRRKVLRAAVTDIIRHRGNNMYNKDIAEGRRQETFIPARRPSTNEQDVTNVTHVVCKHCLGLFKKELLFKHLRNCTEFSENSQVDCDDETTRKRMRLVLSQHAQQLVKRNDNASQILKDEVFSKMKKDELSVAIQSDSLICKFGSQFRNTHRSLRQISYCSNRMRALARIYLDMKSSRPDCIKEFSDCIASKHFDLMVHVVRRMCKYNEESGFTGTPSVTPRLCSSLKRCAYILKTEAIKSESLNREEITEIVYQMNNFLHLMEKDWGTQVGTVSEMSRRRRRVVKQDLLPDPDDIRMFSKYINALCPQYVKELEIVPTVKNYERLAKIIIAHIITLNRRRPNETVEITTEEYRTTLDERIDYGEDSQGCVTVEELESSKDLVIFYVAANKNLKKVPVLLTKDFHRALDVLLASQEKVGVKSKYVFGRPGSIELFDGSAVLREIASKANLKCPASFTANALRHHAATSSQLHAHDGTYTKRLSKFMGHDLQTHEHFYEMPLPLVQKSKVGHKLLQMILPKKGNTSAKTCTVTSASALVTDGSEGTSRTDNSCLSTSELMPQSQSSKSLLVPFDSLLQPPTELLPVPIEHTRASFGNKSCLKAALTNDRRESLPHPLRQSFSITHKHNTRRKAMRGDTSHNSQSQTPAYILTSSPPHSPGFRAADSMLLSRKTLEGTHTPPRCNDHNADERVEQSMAMNDSASENTTTSVQSDTPPKKRYCRKRWTRKEKEIVYETFGQQFLMDMKPARPEIKAMWENETALMNRTLDQVVTYVNNIVNNKHHIPTPTRKKIKRMVVSGKKHLSP